MNGVVVVGDRKVTIGETGQFSYQEKIFKPFHPIIWASSGYQMFYESFNNRVNLELNEIVLRRQREGQGLTPNLNEFRKIVEDVYEQMAQYYGSEFRYGGLSVLVAHQAFQKAELWLMERLGAPQTQTGYVGIGSGGTHAPLFVKRFYEPIKANIDIKDAAQVGYFIIKYIEKFQLDSGVGVSSTGEQSKPQVWFVPDKGPNGEDKGEFEMRQASSEELTKMESLTQERLGKLETNLSDLWWPQVIKATLASLESEKRPAP